jgi:hypothetical protein
MEGEQEIALFVFPEPHPGALFDLHENGKAMALRHQLRTSISIQVLRGYQAMPNNRSFLSTCVYGPHYLLMPVHRSPLLAVVMHNPKQPWQKRFTDSVTTISLLTSIIEAYSRDGGTDYYVGFHDKIEAAKQKCREQTTLYENRRFERLVALYRERLDEKQSLEKFMTIMEDFTLERIHLLEWTVYQMFPFVGPLEAYLTPNLRPNLSVLSDTEIASVGTVMKQFFSFKEAIMNDKLRLETTPDGEEYVPTTWFDTEAIPERLKTTPKEEIYKGYLPRATAREYYVFMDSENILGS